VSADDAARAAASPAATTPAVAETLGLLDTLADRPLAEHPDIYQRAHTRLQQALAEIDDA
jgi:hypothetical protein